MAISPEMTLKIQELRRKAVSGDLTLEDMREGIEILRQGRVGAAIGSTASRTKKAAAKAPVNTGALLAGLMKNLPTETQTEPEPETDDDSESDNS